MLDLHSIYKTFNAGTVNEKTALNGLNLHLNEGDFVTVIGGNGAGKSTMLNAVAGTWFVDAGKITIDDIDVTKLPEHKRAKYLGRVFQDPMTGTAATMQIEENMALAARRGMTRSLRPGITAKEREFYREQLKILGLGLEDRLTSKVGLLSGGQRQYPATCIKDIKQICMLCGHMRSSWRMPQREREPVVPLHSADSASREMRRQRPRGKQCGPMRP